MDKEEIEFDLKCLHNIMNNFEDDLCEKMQIKVNNVKKYIEKTTKENEKLKNTFDDLSKLYDDLFDGLNDCIDKQVIRDMKEFYINEFKNKKLEFIPLSNLIKNINKILGE